MTFVNYIAICGIAFVSAMLLLEFNLKPIWALAFSFYPGMVICLSRGLTEPLAVLFSLTSLYLLYKDRQAVAALFLAMAILTRETTIIIALSGAILWLFQKIGDAAHFNKNDIAWYYFGIPLIISLVWQLVLFHIWGIFPMMAVEPRISIPFMGIYKSILDFLSFKHPAYPIYLLEVIWIIIFAVYVVRNLHKSDWFLKTNWILYGVIAFSMTRLIWSNHPGFFRVLAEFNIFGIIIALVGSLQMKYSIVSIWWFFWTIAAAVEIYINYRL